MTDKELIDRIYDRCPDFANNQATLDQCFDRCQDIINMIDEHRGKSDNWKQEEAGIDY